MIVEETGAARPGPVRDDITAADIRWELAPVEDIPSDDLLLDAVIEAQGYRFLAQRALHQLHHVQLERDILRGQRRIDQRRARELR